MTEEITLSPAECRESNCSHNFTKWVFPAYGEGMFQLLLRYGLKVLGFNFGSQRSTYFTWSFELNSMDVAINIGLLFKNLLRNRKDSGPD